MGKLSFEKFFILKLIQSHNIIRGKLVLQKFFYFLTEKCKDFSLKFEKGHYGPYSFELEQILTDLKNDDYIEEKGSNYTLKNNDFLKNNDSIENHSNYTLPGSLNLTEFHINNLFSTNFRTVSNIELAATIHFLIKHDQIILKSEVFKEVELWKPHKFSEKEKEHIWEILASSDLIPEDCLKINYYFDQLQKIKPGKKDAYNYEQLIKKILNFLFKNALSNGKPQQKTQFGMNRPDLIFQNSAKAGFFYDIKENFNFHVPYIIFECKNLSKELSNPEFSQIITRLISNKLSLGFIICREIINREKIIKYCKNLSQFGKNERKDNYCIICLSDEDLLQMLILKAQNKEFEEILNDKLHQIYFEHV